MSEQIPSQAPVERARTSDWRRMLPGFLVSFLALAVLLYFVDLKTFVDALLQADYRFIILGVVLITFWVVLRAFAWRALLQDKASFKDVFFTISEGYLLNNVLPFRLGEVARAFLLSRKAGLGFWQVASNILIERALDMIFAVALLLSTLPFVVGASWAKQAAYLVGAVVAGGMVGLYLLARYREWALRMFERLAGRIPLLKRLAGTMVPNFLNGISVLTDMRIFLRAVGIMLLNWIFGVVQYSVMMRAFIPEMKILWAAFTLGVAALGVAAPSSPGAVGVLEGSIVAALAVFKVDPSVALAYAITSHAFGYIVYGILGAYALGRDGESLGGLYRKVRELRSAGSGQ